MKTLILLLVAIFVISGFAYAENTEGTNWNTPSDPLNQFLNENAQHSHHYDKYDDPLGIGLNVRVVDFDTNEYFDSVGVELKRDFENNVTSGFLVLNLDISSIFESGK